MIYYISDGEYVKIGYTADTRTLRTRLSTLQIGNARPLVLMMLMPGSIEAEGNIHNIHADQRVRGEWFKAEGQLAWCRWDTPPQHCMKIEDIDADRIRWDEDA